MGPLSNSRTEFLSPDLALDRTEDLKYSRGGGCFVTRTKGLLLMVFIVLMVFIALWTVYTFAPRREQTGSESFDAVEEEIKRLNENHPENLKETTIRLSSKVIPSYYRLKIQTFLDEPDGKNFSFTGHVTIVLQATTTGVKTISLHSRDLIIDEKNVTLTTTVSHTAARLVSLSQVIEMEINNTEILTTTTENVLNNVINSTTVAPPINVNATNESSTKEPDVVKNTEEATEHTKPVTTTVSPQTPVTPEVVARGAITHSDIQVSSILNIRINRHEYMKEADKYTIYLDTALEPGRNYSLSIPFKGLLDDSLEGFYRSSYEENGKTVWMAITHFEPTNARRAFPCFDEPALKARFEISIGRKDNKKSLSNMPLKSSEPMADYPGWTWDNYELSVKMSTYLVAFTVSEFTSLENNASKGIPIKIWARKEVIAQGDYALEVTEKLLDFYNTQFEISYPLPKLDLIAIPDFAAGAMENWGLITFREDLLLKQLNATSRQNKIPIATTIAHELAHQWFGNLVTLKWWSDLWLNEGFATYMENVAVNNLEPSWHMLDEYVVEMIPVLRKDSDHSTHSVTTKINDPIQIVENFDVISYMKSAVLIRMLNSTLTEPVFLKGLKKYLDEWKYDNAEQDDLWSAITIEARLPEGLTVKQIMDSWTLQSGYPLVNVIRNYTTGEITLSQTRFLNDNSTDDQSWYIPINYKTEETSGNNTNNVFWMTQNKTSITLPQIVKQSTSWVLFNYDKTGFYRVNYDPTNWEYLQKAILEHPETFSIVTKAQLIDDAFSLARTGKIEYSTPLSLLPYLEKEEHFIPWSSTLFHIGSIDTFLSESPVYGLFQDFVNKLISNLYTKLGTEAKPGEPENIATLRLLIVSTACDYEYEPCVKWAKGLFAEWMKSEKPSVDNKIPVDFRSTVYCTAIELGTRAEWEFLWKQFNASKENPNEFSIIISSLGCSKETWILNRYLDYAIEDKSIKMQEASDMWRSFSSNRASDVLFQYMQTNWEAVHKKFKSSESTMLFVLQNTLWQLDTLNQYKQLSMFYKDHCNDIKQYSSTMLQAFEKTKSRMNWKKQHYATIKKWLLETKP